MPHAFEPAVVEKGCLRSGTGNFDLFCVDRDRIVIGGLHDDRRQAPHIAIHRRDAGQPRIEGPGITWRPLGRHGRKDQRIARSRSHLVDVECQVGPGADQPECGRGRDSAIAQCHGECKC